VTRREIENDVHRLFRSNFEAWTATSDQKAAIS
jgi:hypothetical protein